MKATGHSWRRFVVLAVLIMAWGSSQAYADMVTATFEGPVTSMHMPAGNPFMYDGTVMMQLVVTYDSAAPDPISSPDSHALYRNVHSVNLSVRDPWNTVIYSASGSGASARFLVKNDERMEDGETIWYQDWISFLDESPAPGHDGTLIGPDIMGMPLWMVSLSAIDYEGTVLSSKAMPTSFTPDIDWDFFAMEFSWRPAAGPNCTLLSTDLTATTSIVPLPGAVLLAGLGMATTCGLRRRQKG